MSCSSENMTLLLTSVTLINNLGLIINIRPIIMDAKPVAKNIKYSIIVPTFHLKCNNFDHILNIKTDKNNNNPKYNK